MKKVITICLLMVFCIGSAQNFDVELKPNYSIDKTKIKRPGNQ